VEDSVELREKPENGRAGLKHWKQDLAAGFQVALLSVSFLGIATASGVSEASGLISLIVAGLATSIYFSATRGNGPYLTIAGPAAGLAVVTMEAVRHLGHGSTERAMPLLFALVTLTGIVQIIFAKLRLAGRLGSLFPMTVAHGMLAGIGVIIIVKQIPHLIGVPFEAHGIMGILWETPSHLGALNPRGLTLAALCLMLIFLLNATKAPWARFVPPPVAAVLLGIVGTITLNLAPRSLIHIPDVATLAAGIRSPNFLGLLVEPLESLKLLFTLALISIVETVATAKGVDGMDPFHRVSDPDRTTLGIGIANVFAGFFGGIVNIPGGVKSGANTQAGGRTQWSAFISAGFLILFLVAGRSIINLIPIPALSAVLVFIGYRLCGPKEWKHIAHIGYEQLFVFTVTVIFTVSTDLLVGILAGLLAKIGVATYFALRISRDLGPEQRISVPRLILQLFRNPVSRTWYEDGVYHVALSGPIVCFNSIHVKGALQGAPDDTSHICLHFDDATLVDHTSASQLLRIEQDSKHATIGVSGVQEALDGMQRLSLHPAATSVRTSRPPPALIQAPVPAEEGI
jgi:MFS superfamily sulfate permease-like transporter